MKTNSSPPRRILIVGGVAGGASAAARARRVDENAEILVFERGPYISFASCGLPYLLSGEVGERGALIARTPEDFWTRARVRVHTRTKAVAIDRARRVLRVEGPDGAERDEPYDRLILSQGARPIVPPIPGADLPHVFTLRDIPDAERIAAFMAERRPTRAVVIGGGFIGLEMAETFHQRGLAVTARQR
jgi:NADPH-dependent 2,4-dienoyl-CoA reductase/sulfur reductase-like enzyme